MKPLPAIWNELSKPLPRGSSADDIPPVITPDDREELVGIIERSDFGYLAEGRANVLFVIKEPPNDPAIRKAMFKGTLLRVAKATPGVTPCDYETLQDFQEKSVEAEVGREHLVPQLLVKISQHVADALNAKRNRNDGSVIHAGYAMLMEDVGPAPGFRVLEFKPKWLAQSPLAPPDATRCRTCAREAFRNSQRAAQGHRKALPIPVCPLGLLHDDRRVRLASIDRLAPRWSERERERLADALAASGVLERLRDLQLRGDRGDALFADPSDAGFGLAMTLRDCSCYVRMPTAEGNVVAAAPVVIKLADVDKKNWREKQTYWRDSHRNLADNGWYRGEEKVDPPVETACVLRLDYCLARGIDDIPAPFRARLCPPP
ncbi:inositol-pentakisphosphate 2-kinase-domain-containing protein [Whalleya microplaca]|nr:inositol-pentakisphosphate 2-kinase-domain-containing protein [Whalleya microplaca]